MTALSPSYELIDRIASSNQDIQTEQSQHAQSSHSDTTSAAEGVEFSEGAAKSPSSGSPIKKIEKSKLIGDVTKKSAVKLMTVEERGEGAVGWNVYQSYFQAANKPVLLVCLMLSFFLGLSSSFVEEH